MTFSRWAICLPRWVLATRTDFARHLADSFSMTWRSSSTSSAAFPLPVPFPGCFDGSGPGLSAKRLKTLVQKRLLRISVVVLNYLFLGRFASLEELGRHPTDLQCRCYERLYRFLAACGSRPDDFLVPPGRSGSELIACISSLENFLDQTNLSGFSYDTKLYPSRSFEKK